MDSMPRRNPPPVPDPARSYERAKPEYEAGMGRLKAPKTTPDEQPDRLEETVDNAHKPRQINAEDLPGPKEPASQRQNRPLPEQPDHSMLDEEPDGWDEAPVDIHKPRDKRHPRTGGKGGTPDAGEPQSRG